MPCSGVGGCVIHVFARSSSHPFHFSLHVDTCSVFKHVQTDESETVAPGKVGQKRRAILQEVDANRKSRRGSGGAVSQARPPAMSPESVASCAA